MKRLIFLFSAFILFLSTIIFSQSQPDPRLLFYTSDIPAIKAKIQSPATMAYRYYQKMVEFNNFYLTNPLPTSNDLFFYNSSGAIVNMAFGALMEDDPLLADQWANRAIILAIDLLQNHDLSHIWINRIYLGRRLTTLIYLYDYCYHRLSPAEKTLFGDEILEDLALFREWATSSDYDKRYNNHTPFISGLLISGALALNNRHPGYTAQQFQDDLQTARNNFFEGPNCYFKTFFTEEGAFIEGTAYYQREASVGYI